MIYVTTGGKKERNILTLTRVLGHVRIKIARK